jgi:hypothetical protein
MAFLQVKRGEKSWAFFPLVYNILLTLIVGLIALIDPFSWKLKITLILILALITFFLCFFNGWFRNLIVGLMSRSQELVEIHDGKVNKME